MTIDNKVVCYYHGDLDGIFAAACVKQKYPQAKFIPVQYGDTWCANDVLEATVIVVDFSFLDMAVLRSHCDKLIWIDHHKTAMETQQISWADDRLAGYRSLEYAGCILSYAYFNMIPSDKISKAIVQLKIPWAVVLAGKYDMWQFDSTDIVDCFATAAMLDIDSPNHEDFNDLLNIHDTDCAQSYISSGDTLIKAAMHRVKAVAAHGDKITIPVADRAVTLMIINATSDISRLGRYINIDLGIDIAAIYEIVGTKFQVHLRSVTCNVESIARAHKGGGHAGAAGFSCKIKSNVIHDILTLSVLYDMW
ncbi:MAG: hypothetical protein WC346_02755 [Methanogenium sp.]|jgi:hypothetical protein